MSIAIGEQKLSDTVETFASSDPDNSYKSLSLWSIFALVASIVSALSLVTVLLWILPVIAICIALFALYAISRSPESLTGSGVAVTAVAIAIFFLALAPTRTVARRYYLASQARTYTDEWLNLVKEGRAAEAFHLTLTPANRSADLETVLKRHALTDAKAADSVGADFFFLNETLRKFLDQPDTTFEFVRSEQFGFSSRDNADELTMRYNVTTKGETFPVLVRMQRLTIEESGTAVWRVEEVGGGVQPY